jgi:hypothetical protein
MCVHHPPGATARSPPAFAIARVTKPDAVAAAANSRTDRISVVSPRGVGSAHDCGPS